ncbi:MAG: hypothetical protein C3F02_03325 [Parcubacteria group bacterium]|nr:MAG: hypothetical protein C3F02_03325 [Parcubacteria group bacterium]
MWKKINNLSLPILVLGASVLSIVLLYRVAWAQFLPPGDNPGDPITIGITMNPMVADLNLNNKSFIDSSFTNGSSKGGLVSAISSAATKAAIYGQTDNSSGYAIQGIASAGGIAGYFDGGPLCLGGTDKNNPSQCIDSWSDLGSGSGAGGDWWKHIDGAAGNIYYTTSSQEFVGIGQSNPAHTLELYATGPTKSNAELDIQSSNSSYWAIYQEEADQNLNFWNGLSGNGSNKVTMRSTGLSTGELKMNDGKIYSVSSVASTPAIHGQNTAASNNIAGYFQGQLCLNGTSVADCISNWSAAGGAYWTANGSNIYNSNAGTITLYSSTERFMHDTGTANVFLGRRAGSFSVSGTNNVGIGNDALNIISTGQYNVVIGNQAGKFITSATHDVGIGAWSLGLVTTGVNNTAVGGDSGRMLVDGHYNVFLGQSAGYSLRTASSNVIVGYKAGYGAGNDDTASNNVLLGFKAGYSQETGSGNVFIGNNAGYFETGSNKLYITNSDTNIPLIYGNFSATTPRVGIANNTPAYTLDVGGSIRGTSYNSSDGTAGATITINVRNSTNTGACTITVKNGLVTATTCP